MFTQKFIKIFHSVQEIGPFSLFQYLALGKATTNDKCHFAISIPFQLTFLGSCNYAWIENRACILVPGDISITGGRLGRHLEYWSYARFAKVAKA